MTPLSQTLRTLRNPLRVQTQSPVLMVSMGRSPSAVRTKVPSAAQRLPPERRRSVSGSVLAPKSLASLPLGQRTTVPPAAVTIFAPGLCASRPDGPVTQDVAASPRVGAMIPIQCGVGPGRQGGP